MSFLAAAVGGGAVLGAGASIYASNQQADAAGKALQFQQGVYRDQQKNFADTKTSLAPYLNSGTNALGYLNRLNSGDMSKFFTSPDYQFRLGQGLDTLQNSAAAKGGLLSGNAMRAISDYGQNTAAKEFSDYWNRMFAQTQLGQQATLGQGSIALGQGQLGASMGNMVGNTMMGIGQANASGPVGAANSINSGIGNYAFLNSYLNKNAPGSAYPSNSIYGGGGAGDQGPTLAMLK